MTSLVCNSFDEQYKRIQTFRNHYLNMIRILLKNKLNLTLTLNQMLTYNEIELNITKLTNSITEFTKNIKKNKKLNNNNLNNHNLKIEDIKIIHTFTSFLPFMILYYNTLNSDTYNVNNTPNTSNISYDYNITNNDTLKIPLD